jgi:hypothetical protein
VPWKARLDLADLNDACCESLADKLRSDLRLLDELGIADDPDMTYVVWAREYLTRYAAVRDCSALADPRTRSAAHLHLVN